MNPRPTETRFCAFGRYDGSVFGIGERDLDSRVFWAVLAALLVFSGVMAVLFALGVVGVRAAAEEAQQQAVVQYQEQQQVARKRALARRRLLGNQRCIGGVVILVDGSSYRQLGTVGNPVRCSGDYADRPIR